MRLGIDVFILFNILVIGKSCKRLYFILLSDIANHRPFLNLGLVAASV